MKDKHSLLSVVSVGGLLFGVVFCRWPGSLVTLVHGGARAAPLALAALSRTLSRAEPMRMNLAPAVCELSQARLEATKLRQQTSTGHGRNFSLRTHPAAHPQEDHLRFLAKTLLPVFFNRRCRRFHCSGPCDLQSIFASPDRTNQNDGSGIAVDCHITLSTVPTLTW